MDYFETLARWQELQEAIKHMQAEEKALRQGIANGTFPEPKEGVNKLVLEDGQVIHTVIHNLAEL